MEPMVAKFEPSQFFIGDRVIANEQPGTIAYIRYAAPDYRQPEAVSVLLDEHCMRPGYSGTVFGIATIRPMLWKYSRERIEWASQYMSTTEAEALRFVRLPAAINGAGQRWYRYADCPEDRCGMPYWQGQMEEVLGA